MGDHDRRDDQPSPAEARREDEELVTAGEEVSDEFGLDQPTDERDRDRGRGKDDPTPNPADIAP
ncbi:hypothetical protein [Euzebya sp.]|uniref:hypothetical protein n=1 Tax=Euzebya sp. TaxID=1971409 RepID=UPI003511A247